MLFINNIFSHVLQKLAIVSCIEMALAEFFGLHTQCPSGYRLAGSPAMKIGFL